MDTWPCEAYGTDGLTVGALCFFSPEQGARNCASVTVCHDRMVIERQRVFRLMNELAAHGDERFVELTLDVDGPDDILRG